MAKKIIWAPKPYEPHANKDKLRWCKFGDHHFVSYKANPPTLLCTLCKKEVPKNWQSTHSSQD